MVGELSVEEIIEILYGLCDWYECYYKLIIFDEVLVVVVKFVD